MLSILISPDGCRVNARRGFPGKSGAIWQFQERLGSLLEQEIPKPQLPPACCPWTASRLRTRDSFTLSALRVQIVNRYSFVMWAPVCKLPS